MTAIRFFVAIVALASAGVGGLRAASRLFANNWLEHGDGWLFWPAWAAESGRNRVLAAAVLALVVIGLSRAVFLKEGQRKLASACLAFAGTPAVLAGALLLLVLPRVVAPLTRPDPGDAPSVVLVLLDTVRLDHTGWGRAHLDRGPELPESPTPRLDRLTARGAAFTQAISHASWTKPAVATLFTGLVPSRHLAVGRPGRHYHPNLEPENRTLAEAFSAAGYDTAAVSTNPNISTRYGFGQGFDEFHWEDTDAEKVVKLGKAWIEERERPFFLYLHFNDAHYPYEPRPPYRGRFGSTDRNVQLDGEMERQFRLYTREYSPEDMEQLRLLYAEEILYLDEQVGGFVEELLDARDDLLVVIVSDHGEEFGEHGDLGHGHTLYDELLRVPLQLAWSTGLRPGRVELKAAPGGIHEQVGLTDVPVTLLALAGLATSDQLRELDGHSLLPLLLGNQIEEDRPVFSETDSDGSPRSGLSGPIRSWREPEWKFIRTAEDPYMPDTPVLGWLFNLAGDPGETRNLLVDEPGRVRAREFARLMQASGWFLVRRLPGLAPYLNPDEMDPEQWRRLSELGYTDSYEGEEVIDVPRDPRAVVEMPLNPSE